MPTECPTKTSTELPVHTMLKSGYVIFDTGMFDPAHVLDLVERTQIVRCGWN